MHPTWMTLRRVVTDLVVSPRLWACKSWAVLASTEKVPMLDHHPMTSNWSGQTNTFLSVTSKGCLFLSNWTYSKTPYSDLPIHLVLEPFGLSSALRGNVLFHISILLPTLGCHMTNLPTTPAHTSISSFVFSLGFSIFPFASQIAHERHDFLEFVRQLACVFFVTSSTKCKRLVPLVAQWPSPGPSPCCAAPLHPSSGHVQPFDVPSLPSPWATAMILSPRASTSIGTSPLTFFLSLSQCNLLVDIRHCS